jgi:hypothetical protein
MTRICHRHNGARSSATSTRTRRCSSRQVNGCKKIAVLGNSVAITFVKDLTQYLTRKIGVNFNMTKVEKKAALERGETIKI